MALSRANALLAEGVIGLGNFSNVSALLSHTY
jgi:hypothetical protein